MDKPQTVHHIQRLADLKGNLPGLFLRKQRTVRQILQRVAGNKLLQHEKAPVFLRKFIDFRQMCTAYRHQTAVDRGITRQIQQNKALPAPVVAQERDTGIGFLFKAADFRELPGKHAPEIGIIGLARNEFFVRHGFGTSSRK